MHHPMMRMLLVTVAAAIAFFAVAGAAFATVCYVANKQPGAGVEGVFYSDSPDRFSIEIPCGAQLNGSPTNGVQSPTPGVCA
jgi:hypothetical protein